MNHYEAKQEARRERLEARAERLQAEARGAFRRADLREEVSGIPFGQPILVGHHSEKRHRAQIARANAAMSKGIALQKAASEAASRAAGVGSGGISSDDPEAVVKLKAELAPLEARQIMMAAVNKVCRAFYKAGCRNPESGEIWERYLAKLREIEPGVHAKVAEGLMIPPYASSPVGFQAYQLSNNGANRLQLIFPGKPAPAIIQALKAHGFRWAPSEKAWQRQLNNGAKWAAECVERLMAEAA